MPKQVTSEFIETHGACEGTFVVGEFCKTRAECTNRGMCLKTIQTSSDGSPGQRIARKLGEAELIYEDDLKDVASLIDSELARERLGTEAAPHDGACDHCGSIPSIVMSTYLCNECADGVKRAEVAEVKLHRAEIEIEALNAEIDSIESISSVKRTIDGSRNYWKDRADKAEAELARERDAGWVSVKERMPDESFPVLFYTNEACIEMGWLYQGKWCCERTAPQDEPIQFKVEDEQVTHWRELPAPPACGS